MASGPYPPNFESTDEACFCSSRVRKLAENIGSKISLPSQRELRKAPNPRFESLMLLMEVTLPSGFFSCWSWVAVAAFFVRDFPSFDPNAISANSRYRLGRRPAGGSNVVAFAGAARGRGAIQTSSREGTTLRGLGFLGMLTTTQ